MTAAPPARLTSTAVVAVLVIADAPRLHRQATRLLGDERFSVISSVASAEDVEVPRVLAADDLVLYLSTAGGAARVAAIDALIHAHPGIRLIATMPADASRSQLRRVVQAGVAGLVVDDRLDEALAVTALAVHAGQLAVPLALQRQVAAKPLSHREKEVLALAVSGLTNRQIADRLFLAESTVKTHLSATFAKLDARNRAEAAALVLGRELNGLGVLPATERQRSRA
jgi:two-component system, NarL family, response regulator DesR